MSDGRFQKGNKLWQRATNPGKPRSYQPDELWDKIVAYLNWCDANPRMVQELGGKNFEAKDREVSRPPTIGEFCIFAGIDQSTWFLYAKTSDYSKVCSAGKTLFDTHNLQGAMAGEYNANIVARLLGLVDKKEVQSNQNNVVLVIPDNGRLIKPQNHVEISDSVELPLLNSGDIADNQYQNTGSNNTSNQNSDEIGSELML